MLAMNAFEKMSRVEKKTIVENSWGKKQKINKKYEKWVRKVYLVYENCNNRIYLANFRNWLLSSSVHCPHLDQISEGWLLGHSSMIIMLLCKSWLGAIVLLFICILIIILYSHCCKLNHLKWFFFQAYLDQYKNITRFKQFIFYLSFLRNQIRTYHQITSQDLKTWS